MLYEQLLSLTNKWHLEKKKEKKILKIHLHVKFGMVLAQQNLS